MICSESLRNHATHRQPDESNASKTEVLEQHKKLAGKRIKI